MNLNIDVGAEVCLRVCCDGSVVLCDFPSYVTDTDILMWVNGTNQSPNGGEGCLICCVIAVQSTVPLQCVLIPAVCSVVTVKAPDKDLNNSEGASPTVLVV